MNSAIVIICLSLGQHDGSLCLVHGWHSTVRMHVHAHARARARGMAGRKGRGICVPQLTSQAQWASALRLTLLLTLIKISMREAGKVVAAGREATQLLTHVVVVVTRSSRNPAWRRVCHQEQLSAGEHASPGKLALKEWIYAALTSLIFGPECPCHHHCHACMHTYTMVADLFTVRVKVHRSQSTRSHG